MSYTEKFQIANYASANKFFIYASTGSAYINFTTIKVENENFTYDSNNREIVINKNMMARIDWEAYWDYFQENGTSYHGTAKMILYKNDESVSESPDKYIGSDNTHMKYAVESIQLKAGDKIKLWYSLVNKKSSGRNAMITISILD